MGKRSKALPPLSNDPERRLNQLVDAAQHLAYERLKDGTASTSLVNKLLVFGTSANELEKTKVEHEIEVLRAKREKLTSDADRENEALKVLEAFRSYVPDVSSHMESDYDY